MLNRFLVALAISATLVSAISAQILKQSDLRKVYGSRWVVLPFPDSRITPGSIVSIKKGQVGWESNLSSCGAPASVLKPVSGSSSKLNFKGDSEYGASAALGIKGVEVGPEFGRVKKTTLKIDDHDLQA